MVSFIDLWQLKVNFNSRLPRREILETSYSMLNMGPDIMLITLCFFNFIDGILSSTFFCWPAVSLLFIKV